jgi:integrase
MAKPPKKKPAKAPVPAEPAAESTRSKPPIKVAKPDGARKHVTPEEYQAIRTAAGTIGRYKHRDSTMIMLGFIHGLRVHELVGLLWEQVNLTRETLHVVRCKRGTESTHPLNADEVKALKTLWKEQKDPKVHVFMTERDGPLTTSAFSKIIARAGKKAGMPFRVGTHMLRHGCGYYFANAGKDTRSLQGYLGHRNISQTQIYTTLSERRFEDWTFNDCPPNDDDSLDPTRRRRR